MKYTIAVLTAIAAFATHPSSGFEPAKRVAQEATFAPEGALECQQTVVGPFKLSIVEGGDEKRNGSKVESADCSDGLVLTLENSALKDQENRTAYISSAFQLQFDDLPQHDASAIDGFSVCRDGYLTLHGNNAFFACQSGDFWNLYDRHHAEQCGAVRLRAEPCAAEGEIAEGSAVGGSTVVVPTKVITELEDGQAQVRSTDVGKVVCQIEDGQVQGHTGTCVNTAETTGTGSLPTGTAHNHTTSATTTAEPSPTEDDEDDSAAGALAIHGFLASSVTFGYAVLAALY